jgi:hypothetical protein
MQDCNNSNIIYIKTSLCLGGTVLEAFKIFYELRAVLYVISSAFLSTGASLRSTETRLTLQVYVSELPEILKCLYQIFMKRERLECMYKSRNSFPTRTVSLYWVMSAFTNPVYLTLAHHAHGLCVIT